jgi:hypothetical protein
VVVACGGGFGVEVACGVGLEVEDDAVWAAGEERRAAAACPGACSGQTSANADRTAIGAD